MITVDITQASTSLPVIIAKALAGEEVYITHPGYSSVRLVPQEPAKKLPLLGLMKGKIELADNFDEWSEEEARSLGIID